MANKLAPSDVAALKKAGFTAAQINKIQSGTAETALMSSAKRVLGQDPQTRYQTEQNSNIGNQNNSPQTAGGWGSLGTALGGIADPQKWADFYGFGNGVAKTAANNADFANGQRSVAPASYLKQMQQTANLPQHGIATVGNAPSPFDYSKSIGGDKGSGAFVKGNPNRYNSFGGPFGTNIGSDANPFPKDYKPFTPGGAGDDSTDGLIPDNPFPDLGQISAPTVSPQDFSGPAKAMVDKAFQPVLDALAGSKTNIGQQGQRARQVLSGLYSNMVNDIATSAAQSHAQYDQQKADTGQRGQQLQQDIGKNYASGQQNVTDTAQKLGLQAAVPQVNQASANDQSWLQGMAGLNTNAMQNYFGQQQQGEDNLNVNRQDVARNSGTVAQENSLNQEGQALQGVDQQIAGVQTDAANKAIDVGQTLSDRDLQAQTTNAGNTLNVQGMNRDQMVQAWQAQNASIDKQNAYNTHKEDTAWQHQMDQANLDLNTQKAAASADKAGGTLDLNNYTGLGKVKASLYNQMGQKGADLTDLAANAFSQSDAVRTGNQQQFLTDVFALGHAKGGYSDDELRQAAAEVWPTLYQKA